MPARLVLSLMVALAAVGLLAAPAAAVTSSDIESALEGWAPTDGSWTETESLDTEGTRGDCEAGHVTRWQNEAGQGLGMLWARCGDAETAAALMNLTWSSNGFFPDPALTPVFGEGLDLASPYPGRDGINRLWTQGEWFLTVARSCAVDDQTGCAAASASDAQAIAALVGLPVDPVVPVTRQPGLLGDWQPTDDNGWRLAASNPLLGDDLERCIEGVSTIWTGLDGGAMEAYWVRCENSDVAFSFQNEKWGSNESDLPLVFGYFFDRVFQYTTEAGVVGVERTWVEGDIYLNVSRTCPLTDADDCAALTARYASEISQMVPGEVLENTKAQDTVAQAGQLVFLVPIVTFLLLIIPQRIFFWWRSRGYSVETNNPDFTTVDALVKRVRISRTIRRVIITVLSLAGWVVSLVYVLPLIGPWSLLYTFFSPIVIFAVVGALVNLVRRPHPLIALARRPNRPSALGAMGALIRLLATAIAVVSVGMYFFASLVLVTDRSLTPATIRRAIEDAVTPPLDPLPFIYAVVRHIAHWLDDRGAFFLVFFLLLVVPITLSWVIDRFGQRLGRRSLQATLATDTRPYFLYLRGFDEDRLRIDESVGRRGFIELFTPFGRPRFEEVLVDYLSRYGPVIAISGGRQVLSDLGAAKITLGNHEWQDKVAEWSAGARAVVMSATPREVRQGLEWEMEHVSSQLGGIRIMLVLSPWSREEIARRWAGFLERAGVLPLFRPLVENPQPDAVQVMTYSPGRGWHGYGAKRRWDWTYAASIITAMDRGDFDAEAFADTPAPARVDA